MKQLALYGLMAGLGIVALLAFAPWHVHGAYVLALGVVMGLCLRVSPGRAFARGWLFAFTLYGLGLYWIYISIHDYGHTPAWLAVLLVIALAAYLALYAALAGAAVAATRQRPAWALLVVLPAAWLLAELLRGWVGTGFPWFSLGYAWLDTPVQKLAPVVGVHGISAVMALCVGAVVLLLYAGRRVVAAGVLALVALGLWLLPAPLSWTQPTGARIKVAVVQANVPQGIKWLPDALAPIKQHYMAMSQNLQDQDLVIWPEVAIPEPMNDAPAYFRQLGQWAKGQGFTLMLGAIAESPQGMRNLLLSVGAQEPPAGRRYIKRHLVPFGEFFPLPQFLKDIMWQLDVRYSNFAPGPAEQPLQDILGVPVGVSICFEDAFGREIRRSLPQAQLLINVTNDAWLDDSPGPAQHLQLSRMRALEAGRQMVRASNRGVSALIAANGQLLQRAPFYQADVLKLQVQPRSGLTPYMRWGNAPLWGGAMLALLLAWWLGRVAARRRAIK